MEAEPEMEKMFIKEEEECERLYVNTTKRDTDGMVHSDTSFS